jgi:hypothetical protein
MLIPDFRAALTTAVDTTSAEALIKVQSNQIDRSAFCVFHEGNVTITGKRYEQMALGSVQKFTGTVNSLLGQYITH